MGIVLKGFDRDLNRYVAIKVLAPHLATSAAARQRFAREARAAAAVVHDHIVAIHAVDNAGRLPYLVMPFVAGQSLQERLDQRRVAGAEGDSADRHAGGRRAWPRPMPRAWSTAT